MLEKKKEVKEYKHEVSPSFTTYLLGQDDLFTNYTCFEQCIGEFLRNKFLFPITDTAIYTDSDGILTDLRIGEGQAQPTSYNTDFNMQTDESFSRIFFYGMGATLLAAQIEPPNGPNFGPFVVDIPLQDLEVRPGFRRHGCRIHFNAEQMVSAIHDYANDQTFEPGEEGWEGAKWLAKVDTFFLVTAREHLIWSHLIVSNSVTRASVINLPPNHPLRRLLTLFTFRSTEINTTALDALVPEYCILHRASALTYPSMQSVFEQAFLSSNAFEPFPERQLNPELKRLSDEGKFPFISDGIEYYKLVEEFVRDWIESADEKAIADTKGKAFYGAMRVASIGQAYEIPRYRSIEDMISLITQIIFIVTAYHELVGNVVDYTSQIDRAGFRIAQTENNTLDVQSLLLTALISGSTSIRMPALMSEYNNFFSAGGAPSYERGVWDRFLGKLRLQSERVKRANETRDVEFQYFDPARFESSVSV